MTDAPAGTESPGAEPAGEVAAGTERADAEPADSGARGDTDKVQVAVLADDLIWATRLDSIVRAAGAAPVPVASLTAFAAALADADAAIVDLSARRTDPFEAIAAASRAGVPVVGVGPHGDLAARKRALGVGAGRVYAYSKLFDDGPRTIAAWLDLPAPVEQPRPAGSAG